MSRLVTGELDGAGPEALAVATIDAKQVSLVPAIFRASDKDPSARNDGTAVAGPRQSGSPQDVCRGTPTQRGTVISGNSISSSATECGPITGRCCGGCQPSESGNRANKSFPHSDHDSDATIVSGSGRWNLL